jgi:DNA primase
MAIVDEDIERIRSSLPIAEVVQPYVALRRVGRNWVGLCPFHAEKSGSFNVRDETGRYKCFGCGASGDVFTFVQEIEKVDFVEAVERLAGKAGVTLRYTTGGETGTRQRHKKLIEAMTTAVEWYHQRLLTDPSARPARDYLRGRGLSGDVARTFKLGWAPDEWDVFARESGLSREALVDNGLAFVNRRNRMQDAFRARVMFPIFNENGQPVAFGGRVLPGSPDPAKYKNSAETPIYSKSRTLYGLNWAKGDVVASREAIVCEGYTDVIGFHLAGLPRAVATCGTALTEEHVRLLKRYAGRVVLAFDADVAGEGAAERFYEWERSYQVEVAVARLPPGSDPAELAASDPAALKAAVVDAVPFLKFRVDRALAGAPLRTPEQRSRVAAAAMTVVNEHPDLNVRKLYAGEVAAHTGLPVADLVHAAERRQRRPEFTSSQRPAHERRRGPESTAISLLVQQWNEIAPYLLPSLFDDDLYHRAFRALAESGGGLAAALELADPEAREVLEQAAVDDTDELPMVVAARLVAAAFGRTMQRLKLELRAGGADVDLARDISEAQVQVKQLDVDQPDPGIIEWLLRWLDQRNEDSE